MNRCSGYLDSAALTELRRNLGLNPGIRFCQAVLQADLRLPGQDLAQQAIIGVPAAYALRAAHVLQVELHTSNAANHVRELVDADHAVLPQVERLIEIRQHQPVNSADAIVDIAEGPSLLAIAPDFDFGTSCQFSGSNFTAQCRRRFLAAAVVGSKRTEDVVEAHNASFHAEVATIVRAQLFGHQLFPAVSILGIGGIGLGLAQGCNVGAL